MKRIGCLIYFYGKRFDEIGACAVSSFKKHNPEVNLHVVGDDNMHLYSATQYLEKITETTDENKHTPTSVNSGAYKFMLALEVMKKNNYDKMIVMGGDTITCARLDEFLDDDDHDILATLDYPYMPRDAGRFLCPNDESHLNADVICFNNPKAMADIVRESRYCPTYAEQGGLNLVVWSGKYKYSYKVVDGPYEDSYRPDGWPMPASPVLYNVRSKGNISLPLEYQDHAQYGYPAKFPPHEKPWGPHLNRFYVKDEKLYNKDHKQIKVWHYCEGFGTAPEDVFKKIVNNYIHNWFNDETKKFFKEQCDCGDFFEKDFTF